MARRRTPSAQLPLPGMRRTTRAPTAKIPRPPTPSAPACSYFVPQGKYFPRYGMRPYTVCITPRQHARLFGGGRKPRRIGCGVFACAYPSPDRAKVVKITADVSDVAALQRAQGLPRIPKLYEAYRLASPTRWRGRSGGPTVYALVLERLRPLSRAMQDRFFSALNCIRKPGRRGEDPAEIAEACCFPGRAWGLKIEDLPACKRLAADVPEAMKDFRSLDMRVTDIHPGNIGTDKNGRWKILDLGLSGGIPEIEPAPLGRRWKRRRRFTRFRRS